MASRRCPFFSKQLKRKQTTHWYALGIMQCNALKKQFNQPLGPLSFHFCSNAPRDFSKP
jgi:hypothetical protein